MSIADEQGGELYGQALFVKAGPHAGRICESDDSTFVSLEELSASEIEWMQTSGAPLRVLTEDADETDEQDAPIAGLDCEVVTFGFYLQSRYRYYIPQQALRPATMKDLVQRYREITEIVGQAHILKRRPRRVAIPELLLEQIYVMDTVWRREKMALLSELSGRRDIFLCHASDDKPFVRQVYMDLVDHGFNTWMDEFEISVGDSIVERVGNGTSNASGLVLFISLSSSKSRWVEREWSSTLMRKLAGNNVKILPCLIEDDAPIPALLSDIKYADFRDSYESGLEQLIRGLAS